MLNSFNIKTINLKLVLQKKSLYVLFKNIYRNIFLPLYISAFSEN